jgi:hypothetical protein
MFLTSLLITIFFSLSSPTDGDAYNVVNYVALPDSPYAKLYLLGFAVNDKLFLLTFFIIAISVFAPSPN